MKIDVTPTFETDSLNYDVITRGVHKAAGVPGATCEIGLRMGGGSKFIMEAVVQMGEHKIKPHVAIDPYGNIPYVANDKDVIHQDYTNDMRNHCMINMYLFILNQDYEFLFFNMTDTQFFARFADGFPTYRNGVEEIINAYSFVHFDGPHSVKALKDEIDFFQWRTPSGAVFVFDDCELYNHDEIDKYLVKLGWECYEKANQTETNHKFAYVKQ